MKNFKLLFSLLLLFCVGWAYSQSTDTQLTNLINTNIRTATTVTRANHANVEQAIVDSKLSIIGVYATAGINTYTVSVPTSIGSYVTNQIFPIRFTNAATGLGPFTLNVNGLGAKNLVKQGGTAIVAADIKDGQDYIVIVDGTNIQLVGGGGSGGAGGDMLAANNLSDVLSVASARTNLGGTTVGINLFTATNPGAVTWPRVNADNTITFRSAVQMLSDIGAQTAGNYLSVGNNLSDVASASTSRTNLGLGTFATLNYPLTTTGDVIIGGASGAPTRLAATTNGFVLTLVSGSPAWQASSGGGGNMLSANNLSDVASVPTSRTNLGGTTAGVNVFTVPNPSAITWLRINADNTVSTRTASQTTTDLGALASANNLSDVANATTARVNLGAISNTAINNELMKSNGTNAVPSGIIVATNGDATFGLAATTGNRNLTTDGSQTDVTLTISTKGIGEIGANATQGSTSFLVKAKAGHTLAFNVTNSSNTSLLSITQSTGVATFSSLPTIPLTPSATTDAASKGYVDSQALGPFSTTAPGYTNLSGNANSIPKGNNTWIAPGTNGHVLTLTAGVPGWAAAGGSPGGSNTQVQFNNSGVFGGNANFTINNGTGVVTFGQAVTIPLTPVATTDAASKGYVDGFVLPAATATTDGYLTSVDWTAFNNKPTTAIQLTGTSTLIGAVTVDETTTAAYTFKFLSAGLGTTQVNGKGIWLINNTAAGAGAQQISGAIVREGQGWKTTATAASQSVRFADWVTPIQGTANPTGQWDLYQSINGAAYSSVITALSSGIVGIGTTSPGLVNSIQFSAAIGSRLHISNTAAGAIFILDGNNAPIFLLNDQSRTANNRLWGISTVSSNLIFQAYTDALSNTNVWQMDRSGNVSVLGSSYFGALTAPIHTVDVGGSFGAAITSTSTDITLGATHYTVKVDASGANRTITLPAASGVTRRIYIIKKTDATANTVTIDGNASETIDGATTKVINTQWAGYMIQCDGTNWIVTATF